MLLLQGECAYRLPEKRESGLKLLNDLEKLVTDKESALTVNSVPLFQIELLKGKLCDSLKRFEDSSKHFKQSLETYSKSKVFPQSGQVLGNLQFRYGWSLIRSKASLDEGLDLLKLADSNLKNNFDLKVKMAQIFSQEKHDIEQAITYIEGALRIKPTEPDALLMHAKLLMKIEEYSLSIE